MTFGAVGRVLRPGCDLALDSFVGRSREMRDIRNLLPGSRLMTLTGAGGVGKSRLAQRVATTLPRSYDVDIAYVDLAEVRDPRLLTHEWQDSEVLAHLVAGALGISERDAGSPTDLLCRSLAPRRMLLLLDNCERRLPACAVLADTLLRACPELQIMATSREPLLLVGEVIFPVPSLPTPDSSERTSVAELDQCDSVRLFVTRAQAIASDFALTEQNAPVVAELCRRLDGLPLAIELAAARVRVLAPAQILERTKQRFALLSRGQRTAPPRQQTLRACVDWSFELCSKPEWLLWARLSVFHGTFELDAVQDVCIDATFPAEDLLDLIAGLVDKSILISESSGGVSWYRMLETLRDYGEEKLIEVGEQDELRRRHRDWYRGLLRRTADDLISPRQGDRLARLDRELPNLRAALAYSLADPEGPQAALEMATGLARLWATRGGAGEGRSWLGQALARATAPTMTRMEALYGNAALAAAQNDLAAARASVRQAHDLASQLCDARADAIAACADGALATATGEPAEAVRAWRSALDMLEAERNDGWRVVALGGLGKAAALLGDADAATTCHDALVKMCPPNGDSLFSGRSLGSLGLASWKLGDLATAAGRLRESLRRLGAVNDAAGVAGCLLVFAWIACEENRAERAATLLGAATRLGQSFGPAAGCAELSSLREVYEERIQAALGESAYRSSLAGGARLRLDEAVAFAIEERHQPPTSTPGEDRISLTRREQQVAELVAQGQSNKAIAAALFISQRTAESHVQNILSKLGFANRAHVAAWMAAQRHPVTAAA